MNKIIICIIVLALIGGCIKKEEEKIPSVFRTDSFRIGDEISYELWGKMIVRKDEGGFLIYSSKGEATIKVKEAVVKDGFDNEFNVVDFYMVSSETPYNYTKKETKGLDINLEKHVYRLYDGKMAGGILKSVTIHHAINRERHIEINSMPTNDFIDFFLQKDFKPDMNGSFYYEGMKFSWKATYDKKVHALRINISANASISLSIWMRNGYPLPYRISFSSDDGIRYNEYTYVLKKFKKGGGNEFHLGDINYTSKRDIEFYNWKDFGAPEHGEGSKLKLDIRVAMAQALSYAGLKQFLKEYPGAYMVYAEYWQSKKEAGWLLHFGRKNMREDYVLNISNTGRTPIPSTDLSPYLAYKEIPKDIEDVNDKMISVADAEKIFEERIDFEKTNFSFQISFVENYYPDTLFDIWEGNSKEKEITIGNTPRGACLIRGLSQMVKDYSFGYRLIVLSPPFIPFEGKINGENGMVTYVYEEY